MGSHNQTTELVAAAEAIVRGEMHLIEGCRKICSLRHKMQDPDNAAFLPLRGIESETDHFPLGEVRKQYAPDYLRLMDAEMERYLAAAREDILKACHEIIRIFSKNCTRTNP